MNRHDDVPGAFFGEAYRPLRRPAGPEERTGVNPAKTLLHTVRETMATYGMIRPGDGIVVAVSGGSDSLCLLDVLCRLAPAFSLRLAVAHFDHGLREGEDESETRFVRQAARERGLPFEVERASYALRDQGGSLEERAREARYAFLERARQAHGAKRVAVGHTLDDQAETVLMRLLRGAGPDGLAAIPPVRDPGVIRPLIQVRRRDVQAYLEEGGISWLTDSSNLLNRHLRNRIRRELLPELLTYQPRLVEHLGVLADLCREENKFLGELAGAWVEGQALEDGEDGSVALPLTPLLELSGAFRRRVIRHALGRTEGGLRRIDRRHVASVEGLVLGERSQAGIDLPGDRCAERIYDRIVLGPRPTLSRPEHCTRLPGPGAYPLKEAGLRILLQEKPRQAVGTLERGPWTAFLDADTLRYPLEVRAWRPGDRLVPLGMRGHRKVKDLLIDRKVPLRERAQALLLLSGGRPLWLCGLRIDDRFKVTEETRRVLEVRIEPLGGVRGEDGIKEER